MKLSYEELSHEITEKLAKAEKIVLATSADNIVTARTMCPVNKCLTVMFSTDGKSLKVEQIKRNPGIALVADEIQIEAIAELFGHPSGHPEFCALNDAKYPWMKDAFKPSPDGVDDGILIICHPKKITLYKYIDGKTCWDVLDISKQTAARI